MSAGHKINDERGSSHYNDKVGLAIRIRNIRCEQKYVESTWKPLDRVRYSFSFACLDNWLKRIVATNSCKVQTFHEGRWSKCTSPIRISLISYTNFWGLNKTRTCFLTVVVCFISFACVAWIGTDSSPIGNLFVTVTDLIPHTDFNPKYCTITVDCNCLNTKCGEQFPQ